MESWVPVSERLPEVSNQDGGRSRRVEATIRVRDGTLKWVAIMRYMGAGAWWGDCMDEMPTQYVVTAWRDLPEPYEDVEGVLTALG